MSQDIETSSSSTPLMATKNQSVGDKALTGLGNLIKLLPTGTIFLYQFLSPVLTNYGKCHTVNKALTAILLFVCGFICTFACFIDSYIGKDGKIHYGIVTKDGLWPLSDSDSKSVDLSQYKLRLGDFAHAILGLIVFATVALLDPNVVECYYSSLVSTQKVLLMVLPPVIGAVASTVFTIFPNTRHGIGYPATQATENKS